MKKLIVLTCLVLFACANSASEVSKAGSLDPESIGYTPNAEVTDVLYPGLYQLEQGPEYGPVDKNN